MSAGKGDTPRPVDGEKFRANYEVIFRNGKAAGRKRKGRKGGK